MKYAKLKKIDRKTKEQVGWRFEFRSYNPKTLRYEPVKREALPQYILETQDEEVIKKYCDSQSAEEDAVKHRAKIRAEWRKRFSDFDLLLKEFEKYQKKSAPNSYENDVYYLERYALYWFLSVKDSNNYLNWPIHYAEFKDWLKSVKPLKWNKDKLSLNTQNKIIKALNRFLDMISVAYQKQIDKCPQYSRAELTRVSARDILDEDEINKIQDELKQIRPASHDFFTVLVNTGLRENEAMGLCLSFVIEGKLQGKKSEKMHQLLERTELGADYFGYIVLESQPACAPLRVEKSFKDRFGKNWPTNSVPRKPLKLRNSISPENHRIIPVYSKLAWKILATRWNEQSDLFADRKFGNDERNYLLFDGLTVSMFYNDLVKAFERAKLYFRSPHKLRHTYATVFYEKTDENRFLAKKVIGHNEERSMQIYSHLAEQIALEQTQKSQSKRKMKIV